MNLHHPPKTPVNRIRLVMVLSALLLPGTIHAQDQASTPSSGGGSFHPFTVTLQPQVTTSPLPPWDATTPDSFSIQPDSDSVSLAIPSLAAQDEIGCFALTVVFQDDGDGGPVVEWLSKDGGSTLLSAGLGENGVALGLNSRTLLLSQSLAIDGGTVRISFAGRFKRLLSLTLRPAQEVGVGSLDNETQPALLEGTDRVLNAQEVSGADEILKKGDSVKGSVVDAELSASPVRLDLPGTQGMLEFDVPVATVPSGSYLHADVGGLDPASSILVQLNGVQCGAVGMSPFPLDDPSIVFSNSGRLLLAGWRRASLFLPAALWQQGENSIVLTLARASGDEGNPVYLQKTRIDLLMPPAGASESTNTPGSSSSPTTTQALAQPSITPQLQPPPVSPSPTSSSPTSDTATPDETLSTGSLYGNPSPSLFHATPTGSLPADTNASSPGSGS